MSDTKTLTASKIWLHRFGKRFELKNIKIIGEAASADVEAVVTFPEELKLFRIWFYPQFQSPTWGLRTYSPVDNGGRLFMERPWAWSERPECSTSSQEGVHQAREMGQKSNGCGRGQQLASGMCVPTVTLL